MSIEINDSNFEEVVLKSDKPVLVNFKGSWCNPCRMLAPVIDSIGEDFAESAVVVKMDVDDNPLTSTKYGIRNIPALLFFKNGEVVDKQIGAAPKSTIVTKLNNLL